MYTANTMSSSFEALGMSMLAHRSLLARPGEGRSAAESAKVLVEAVKKQLKPRDIVTRKFDRERGLVIMATAARRTPFCYLAIAHAAEIEWTIDDFERVRRKVPVLCDLKPSGK